LPAYFKDKLVVYQIAYIQIGRRLLQNWKGNAQKTKNHFLVDESDFVSINNLAKIYHWKLVGDSPECILKHIEFDDENLINHILVLCGLYHSKKKQYTKDVPKFGLDNRKRVPLKHD
jgi:hypothetical protein